MDVIEHTEDPLSFIELLSGATASGGTIVIGTGNSDSASWRLMKSKYWYCYPPEHISFINPTWAKLAASNLGLKISRIEYFSHSKLVYNYLPLKAKELIINFSYFMAPSLFARLRKLGFGGVDASQFHELADTPPSWMTSKDHILVVFHKE